MPEPSLTVYGSDWCSDCRRAKRILTNLAIPYRWVDIELDKQGEQYVLEVNRGMRSIPTILFEDGSVLVEPSSRELSSKLGVSAN